MYTDVASPSGVQVIKTTVGDDAGVRWTPAFSVSGRRKRSMFGDGDDDGDGKGGGDGAGAGAGNLNNHNGSRSVRRIISGDAAVDGEQDWIVRFQSTGCGGMLIAPGWVLSAAHCFCFKNNGTVDPTKTSGFAIVGLTQCGMKNQDTVAQHAGAFPPAFKHVAV
jgi:hypothetical protein